MSFSTEWEQAYAKRTHLTRWPWSDLVSLVMRYVRPSGCDFRVLELGAGPGANAPFFLNLKVDYWAIEGSASAAQIFTELYPELQKKIIVADFTKPFPVEGTFDLIFDRAALTHNSTIAIQRSLNEAHRHLKPGGHYLGVDWFSTEHQDFARGEAASDRWTRQNYREGFFQGVGPVHFSDQAHLEDLFHRFQFLYLQHTERKTSLPLPGLRECTWNFITQKL